MAKGENIFKRKDGRWEARYVRGRKEDGSLQYGFCYASTYREVKKKAAAARIAVAAGAPPAVTRTRTFSFYCDEWLTASRGRLRDSTYAKYLSVIESHIKPALGCCRLQNFSIAMINGFTAELRARRLSPKTVRDILSVLRSVIKYAGQTVPGAPPSSLVSVQPVPRREARVLTRDEQEELVNYLLAEPDPCKIGVLIALLTGLRIGELCALRWKNISLDAGTVTVSATMQRLKNLHGGDRRTELATGSPKSESSQRVIPLTAAAAAVCRSIYRDDTEAYLLSGTRRCVEPRTLQYRFKKYTADCGLDGVHFHTLRHTFATRCVEAGMEIKTLSEILGHSSTVITLDKYVHSSLDAKRRSLGMLDGIVDPDGKIAAVGAKNGV